jgi:small subunit ribosomal protein S1
MPDNIPDNESFADLFNDDTVTTKQLSPGEKITATVVEVSPDSIFLDIGEKSEGFLVRKELEDETGAVTVSPGDTLEVYFLSTSRNEMLFTTKIGSGAAGRAHLEDAYHSAIPLEGHVEKEIKGGFEVTIAGKVRAFCPYSQMGLKRVSDPESHVGEHMLFKITKFSEGGRNIVLSHRILLEEERQQKREELREQLQEGMTVQGRITSIKDFGAFVDIGGIEGLIPISEIGWSRTEKVGDILSEDQDVEVVILKLDWENDRFSFSLKQALPDPWQDIALKFPAGSFHTGKVVRLAKFGAFVNLAAGIDGLIHISKLAGGRRINHPREVVEEGQSVDVKIETADPEEKRLSLSLVGETAEEETDDKGADMRQYLEQQGKPGSGGGLGTLGEMLKQKLQEKEQK